MTRIIAGLSKNTRLKVPKRGTRPITDRAKSALFSILYGWLENATVLDLFAGSGSMGIEALSRGARFAVFVDDSEEAAECLEINLDRSQFYEHAEIINDSVENFVKKCNRRFDLVFIDPPYQDTEEKHILLGADCIKKEGLIILKHSPKLNVPEEIENLKLIDTRTYGKNAISFFQKKTSTN